MPRSTVLLAITCAIATAMAVGQQQGATSAPTSNRVSEDGAQGRLRVSKTLLVLPFENASAVPGIEWIGEAFPEVIGERLNDQGVYVLTREDRLHADERLGIPATLRPSRATLYRIAEQMDADFAVLGSYRFDGQTFTASAQLLDLKKLHLGSEFTERGPLPNLMDVTNAVAWDVLHELQPDAPARATFLSAAPSVRLDAFENYIRGITAPTHQEQIRRLKEAVRLSPEFERAMYQLGHADFESRDYQDAVTWLTKLHHDTADAREGMFYAALAAYSQGDYAHAEEWFGQLAARMPLTEVLNDLAVAQARLGKNTALQSFQRAVQADPNDPDYRYNYAVALYRSGDSGVAARQLREALALKPNDSDAKSLLDAVSAGAQPAKAPAERIKRNYDETAFRLAELEVERATEARLATADPATHARYHLERGRELFNEGLAAEAEKHFREACQLDPQNAAAHAALASVLEREGDVKNARTEAEAATSSSPSAEAYIVLTRLDMRAGDLTAAAMDVERALTLQPGNAAAQMLDREIKARRLASQKSERN